VIVYEMTHVFQTSNLALNEPIQQGLSPAIDVDSANFEALIMHKYTQSAHMTFPEKCS
jgi:hypothetical protein